MLQWFFLLLAINSSSKVITQAPATVGPFNSQAACEAQATATRNAGPTVREVSPCFEGWTN